MKEVRIRERRERVRVGKRETRPVTVRYRTVPMLTEEQREDLLGYLSLAAVVASIVACGLIEGSTCPM